MIYTRFKVHLYLNTPPFSKVNFFEKWDINETGEVLASGFFFADPATKVEGIGPFVDLQEAVNAYLMMLWNVEADKGKETGSVIRVDFKAKQRLDSNLLKPKFKPKTGGTDAG